MVTSTIILSVLAIAVPRSGAFLRLLLNAILRMLHIHFSEDVLLEGTRKWFNMHVIAITSTFTAAVKILLAFGITEVSDGRIMSNYFTTIVKAAIDVLHGVFCVLFGRVFDINVANNVLTKIVYYHHLLNFS
jgi:hypothetical protein